MEVTFNTDLCCFLIFSLSLLCLVRAPRLILLLL